MRKYIIGFIAGILVATAGVAAADTVSMIGKKIQSEAVVTLDGEEIGTALIVNGTSYPPLRVIAESVGVGVGWENGVVKLETQRKQHSLAYWEQTLVDLNGSLESALRLVANTENKIETGKQGLEKWENILNGLADDASETIRSEYEERIEEGRKGLKELENELAERKARADTIKAQIAEAETEVEKLN